MEVAMQMMHAAVVTSFDEPPHYQDFEIPTPTGDDQQLVDVLAVGLHPRTRSGASGSHYTSSGTLPMIPGVDGVGRRQDGQLVYFTSTDDVLGTMADKALADNHRSVALPSGVDVERVAAAMNPAMSSWVALRRRIDLQPGQSVLILGATGNAGSMAIQIAKLLGAGRVVGAGRSAERLAQLPAYGADETVQLTGDAEATGAALAQAAGDVDVVIDYLWGPPAQQAMIALLTGRMDRSRALDWIQIGALAGATLELPSAALRSANLRLQGSGQGSVSPKIYLAELPSLVEAIDAEQIAVTPKPVALAEVGRAWAQPDVAGERVVLIP
jgi:NADPH:quinone reductase-like Zn-dependent oxidoreductase